MFAFLQDVVPDTLINLKQLIRLEIHNTRISNMTEQLVNLSFLSSLIVIGCSLTRLPSFHALQNLYQVQLQNNRLSRINGLNGLQFLYLDNNLFADLPVVTGPENLSVLSMNGNPLKHVMSLSLFANLRYLYLGNTTISSIPPTIDKLQNLYNLDISNNKLFYLPKNILKLVSLTRLYLTGNHFATDELATIKREFNATLPNCTLYV